MELEASRDAAGLPLASLAPQLLEAVVAYTNAKTADGFMMFEALLRGCIDPLNDCDSAEFKPVPEAIQLIDLRQQILSELEPFYRLSEFTGKHVVYHAGKLESFDSRDEAVEKLMLYKRAPETRFFSLKLVINFGDEGIQSATKSIMCSSRADARALMYDTILFFDMPATFAVDGEPEGTGRLEAGFKSEEHRLRVIEAMNVWSGEWTAEEPDPARHAKA